MFTSNKFIAFVLFLVFFIIGIATVSSYGINWDEPAHYLRGQAYLRFFLTGKTDYKDLPEIREYLSKSKFAEDTTGMLLASEKDVKRSMYQYDLEGEKFTFPWYKKYDTGHPPLNGILASFFNYVLYQKLNIVADIDSYHIFIIFISSLLVGCVFLFTASYYGRFAGLVAALSLACYPLFFAESHVNIKDPVEATFYSFTVFSFFIGITKNNWKWVLFSGFWAGLALGTKFNIFFVGIVVIPWLVIYKWNDIKKIKWPFKKNVTLALLLLPCIAGGILFLSWPYLWSNPVQNFSNIVSYYKQIGGISYQSKSYLVGDLFNTYAMQWVVFTTPVVVLILAILGIIYVFFEGKNEKSKLSFLILLWVFLPIFRVSAPSSGIYGGVRQIMEYIPALAILAGIGAWWMRKNMLMFFTQTNTYLYKIITVCFFLLFLPLVIKLAEIHPNQNVYFNELVGGLSGARERNFIDWGSTMGTVYKQGTNWLNKNTEKESELALLKGLHANVPRSTLRSDINFNNRYYSGVEKKGEYIMEVTDYRWEIDIPQDIRNYLSTMRPVYEVKVDGVAILTIWKNDQLHVVE